ncbi:MerR family transcriptional regulator [Arthrobacter sp. ISL-95]|uniref:MerR family transcriptional regulator n=1 Tax=Arthrobacter sp. ISL-95 TaxID=2819116 RepID=UPI002852EFB0|nr:MerR family transcriptional regulator [Arthrobacter sp. ISL-95]
MTAKTSSTNTMHIGELADRTGLSLRTIRHYDDVGLLPATARTDGGFRVFSEDDFERLMVIKQMKPLGFSLEEMAEILALLAAPDVTAPERSATLAGFLEGCAPAGKDGAEPGSGRRVHSKA